VIYDVLQSYAYICNKDLSGILYKYEYNICNASLAAYSFNSFLVYDSNTVYLSVIDNYRISGIVIPRNLAYFIDSTMHMRNSMCLTSSDNEQYLATIRGYKMQIIRRYSKYEHENTLHSKYIRVTVKIHDTELTINDNSFRIFKSNWRSELSYSEYGELVHLYDTDGNHILYRIGKEITLYKEFVITGSSSINYVNKLIYYSRRYLLFNINGTVYLVVYTNNGYAHTKCVVCTHCYFIGLYGNDLCFATIHYDDGGELQLIARIPIPLR
jgi:hypothetical protein